MVVHEKFYGNYKYDVNIFIQKMQFIFWIILRFPFLRILLQKMVPYNHKEFFFLHISKTNDGLVVKSIDPCFDDHFIYVKINNASNTS